MRRKPTEGKNNLKQWLIGTEDKPGLLVKRGIGTEDFAYSIGLTRSAVYFFLEDNNRPSPQTLAKMCKVLGVTIEEGLKHVDPRATGRPAGTKETTPRRKYKRRTDAHGQTA